MKKKSTLGLYFRIYLIYLMAFTPVSATDGSWRLATNTYKKTASTALTNGCLLAFTTGYAIAATSSTTNIIGILQKTVAATDSDYASNSFIPVLVPRNGLDSLMLGDVTGTAVATDAGSFFDLSDSLTVNRAATSVKIIFFAKFLSATRGIFALNSAIFA